MEYMRERYRGYILYRGIYFALLAVEIYNIEHLLMVGKLKRQSMMTIYGLNVNISKNNNIMNLQ